MIENIWGVNFLYNFPITYELTFFMKSGTMFLIMLIENCFGLHTTLDLNHQRMREWKCSSTILDLGTRWKKVVSFTHLLLCTRKKSPRYSLNSSLLGPHGPKCIRS
jgi:hypothetical protein